jgi:hypothetical protein
VAGAGRALPAAHPGAPRDALRRLDR